MAEASSHFVDVDGLRIHYRNAGQGLPVVLLHGWPTSSFLWRNVMPAIAQHRRAIAIDLPGFGRSDKPLDASYSFRFHARVLDGVFAALDIERLGLAVHDLGGPIGLYWACHNPDRIERLALLNTIVYPEMSWAVVAFVASTKLPLIRNLMTSGWGLRMALRLGVGDRSRLRADALEQISTPFERRDDRRALAKAGHGLSPKGFVEIADTLPQLTCPVRVVYGARDRILPDVAKTMRRVTDDLPQTELTELPDCGHFLQEDRPDEVGRLLAEFFAARCEFET